MPSATLHDPYFESGIVKVLNGQTANVTKAEVEVMNPFLVYVESTSTSASNDDDDMETLHLRSELARGGAVLMFLQQDNCKLTYTTQIHDFLLIKSKLNVIVRSNCLNNGMTPICLDEP